MINKDKLLKTFRDINKNRLEPSVAIKFIEDKLKVEFMEWQLPQGLRGMYMYHKRCRFICLNKDLLIDEKLEIIKNMLLNVSIYNHCLYVDHTYNKNSIERRAYIG